MSLILSLVKTAGACARGCVHSPKEDFAVKQANLGEYHHPPYFCLAPLD
jgi:hypothetical protein